MARTDRPDSATAQFFINTVDNPGLDRARAEDGVGYCVFGKVLSGMDVLNQIENVPTGRQFQEMEINAKTFRVPHDNVPRTDVLIKSIRRR
jgi:cyclophilin family peptidyl-prolyl cis-trans isomerase